MIFDNILFICNCFLLVRLFTQWSDTRIKSIKKNLLLASIEFILLAPVYSSWSFVGLVMIILVVYHFTLFMTERKSTNIFSGRIIQLLVLLFSSGFLLGISGRSIRFNKSVVALFDRLFQANIFTRNIAHTDVKFLIIYAFGLLIAVIEVNHIIRAILKSIKASPHRKKADASDTAEAVDDDDVDTDELKRGKIIGAIERVLFFFFVLSNNYTSIGFILAAKGITRFKELDDKDFAEYVLIGTLLSSSLSILLAELIKRILITA